MSLLLRIALLPLLLALTALARSDAPRPTPGPVLVLEVSGVIGPASSDFILTGLDKAAQRGAELVVVQLDTPGGLDSAMRDIIKAILASRVPVATYVHPAGARAASAGTYILYASHIAAMTPATNLGAATPVSIGLSPGGAGKPEKPDGGTDGEAKDDTPAPGSTMERKVINDATAYLQGLAELRGRDGDFARRAVREAASLSAEEALKAGVIDVLATDLADLLAKVDGRRIETPGGERALVTATAPVERLKPDWRNRLLGALANPQLALVLMMIGIYGLFFEFTSPGFGVPGVAGAICLLLALYAFQMLPVNWVGVALIAFGAALMLAEAFLPSFGVLGVGGLIAFVLGGLFLIDSELPAMGIPLPFLGGIALLSAASIFAIGTLAARGQRRPLASGSELMVGTRGTVSAADAEGGWAQVAGESWRIDCDEALRPGDEVRVAAVAGLHLKVERLPHESETPRR